MERFYEKFLFVNCTRIFPRNIQCFCLKREYILSFFLWYNALDASKTRVILEIMNTRARLFLVKALAGLIKLDLYFDLDLCTAQDMTLRFGSKRL